MVIIVFADDITLKTNKEIENNKIHISADKLISSIETGYIEFVGNIRATQKNTVINADKLKVFLKMERYNNKGITDKDSIQKIVADGNVKIWFDNRIATAEQAVYHTQTGILVLSGANSKVISGNDSIAGAKITLSRKNGRIQVESSDAKRVEAIIYPKERGKAENRQKENDSNTHLFEF